jgi:hypothetical protein
MVDLLRPVFCLVAGSLMILEVFCMAINLCYAMPLDTQKQRTRDKAIEK